MSQVGQLLGMVPHLSSCWLQATAQSIASAVARASNNNANAVAAANASSLTANIQTALASVSTSVTSTGVLALPEPVIALQMWARLHVLSHLPCQWLLHGSACRSHIPAHARPYGRRSHSWLCRRCSNVNSQCCFHSCGQGH